MKLKVGSEGLEIDGVKYASSDKAVAGIIELIEKLDKKDVESGQDSTSKGADENTALKTLDRDAKKDCITEYFDRMAHERDAKPLVSTNVVVWSWIGSFLGILTLCWIHYEICLKYTKDQIFIVGSFGAQAVLLFAAPHAPLAQPWNAVAGNGVSAFAGIAAWHIVGEWYGNLWLAGACAVSFAIVFMHLTNSLHPPGGATALIAVMQMERVNDLSFLYILFPAVLASMVHVLVALIVNNLSADPARCYPKTWKPFSGM